MSDKLVSRCGRYIQNQSIFLLYIPHRSHKTKQDRRRIYSCYPWNCCPPSWLQRSGQLTRGRAARGCWRRPAWRGAWWRRPRRGSSCRAPCCAAAATPPAPALAALGRVGSRVPQFWFRYFYEHIIFREGTLLESRLGWNWHQWMNFKNLAKIFAN